MFMDVPVVKVPVKFPLVRLPRYSLFKLLDETVEPDTASCPKLTPE
jgi:hypothetical protein